MKVDNVIIVIVFLALIIAGWMIFFKKSPAYKSTKNQTQPNQALQFIGGQPTNYPFD